MPRDSERLPLRALLLTAALTCLAYASSFSGIPQFDDYSVVVDNPAVASLAAWRDAMPGIRPLLKLSYALNNSGGGLAGFHAVNLLLHLGNVVLVLALLRRLLPAAPDAALAGTLLFALHPVNTEAVAMLSGRSVSLTSLFFLGSVLAHLRGRLLPSLLAFVAAVATRETALALPPALTLVAFWVGGPGSSGSTAAPLRAALRATRWHWLLGLVALVGVLALPRYRELLAFSFGLRTPLENLVTQGGAVLYLLGQLLRPWALNADPQLPVFAGWSARWLFVVLVWGLLFAWAAVALRQRRWSAFALWWLLIVLAPGSSLIPRLDPANERQLYLAAIPLFALAGIGWQRLRHRWRAAAMVLGWLVLGGLGVATWQRNTVYGSETAFWSDVATKSPRNARAWNNLGYALEREHPAQPLSALRAYERALMLDPGDFKAYFNRQRLCSRAQLSCAAPPPG